MLSIAEIRQFIKTIPDIVRDLSYEQLSDYCNKYLNSIPVNFVHFDNAPFSFQQHEYSGHNVLYRGRPNEAADESPFLTVEEVSYVPDEKLKKIPFGRANKKEESMFYGSTEITTACFEAISKGLDIKSSQSKMVTLGIWHFEKSMKLVQLPYSEKYWKKYFELSSFVPEKITEKHMLAHNEHIKTSLNNELGYEVLQLFADAFATFEVDSEHDYYLSNYYADRVFNRIPNMYVDIDLDGIIYPSVLHSYQESNILLKPNVVDKKMKFWGAMHIWVTLFNTDEGTTIQFSPIQDHVNADENGNLLWFLTPPYHRRWG